MKLALHFYNSDKSPELAQIDFDHGTELRTSYRGKASLGLSDAGSFQWTNAVRAFAQLVVGSRLNLAQENSEPFVLSGEGGSPAASLDYAISKPPHWMSELFGNEESGRSKAQRIFRRENTERKLPGPVKVMLSKSLLEADSIHIRFEGRNVTSPRELQELFVLLNSDSGASSASLTPTDEQSLVTLFSDEARRSLQETEVLEPLDLDLTALRLKPMRWVEQSVLDSDCAELQKHFPALNERYTEAPKKILETLQKVKTPLTIACVPMALGALLILRHLQTSLKANIEINFEYPGTTAILESLGSKKSNQAVLLSWGAAMKRSQFAAAKDHVALLRMPRTAMELIVSQSYPLKTKPLESIMLAAEESSYPYQYFQSLCEHTQFCSAETKILNASQSEIATHLTTLNCGAVLSFPFSAISAGKKGVTTVDRGNKLSRIGDNILYVPPKLEPDLKRALIHAVRQSWYELLEDQDELKKGVEALLKDKEYRSYVTRIGGFYRS